MNKIFQNRFITQKSNKQFMILSFIGIVMVVDAHAWTALSLFTDYFPYNSFFMPMFIFISGYFYKNKNITFLNLIKEKLLKYIVPYYILSILLETFIYVLNIFHLTNIEISMNFTNIIISPLTKGYLFDNVLPSWFVPVLFFVTIFYAFLDKYFQRFLQSSKSLILFLIFGIGSIYVAKNYYYEVYVLILKIIFFLPFYQLGRLYKLKYEVKIKSYPRILILFLCLLINSILINRYGDINFANLFVMGGFLTDNYALPFITSITGILFWLTVSSYLVPLLGNNKICNYISCKTYTIMMVHVTFMVLFNVLLYIIKLHNGFQVQEIIYLVNSSWTRETISIFYKFCYFCFGMGGSLLFCVLEDWFKDKIWLRKFKHTTN